MPDSIRLTVLKRLTAILEGITLANGYDFDLSNAVFRGRALFGESDPKTMVSIIEATRPDPGRYAGYDQEERSSLWPLIIQGYTNNDLVNPSDPAYRLMAAVEKQLNKIKKELPSGQGPEFPEFYMLGEGPKVESHLIAGFTFGPGVVSPPREQVSPQAFFFLPVWISLAGNPGQPYFETQN